jgi:uncharacterized membrane protein YsdA (DUF1294 family)
MMVEAFMTLLAVVVFSIVFTLAIWSVPLLIIWIQDKRASKRLLKKLRELTLLKLKARGFVLDEEDKDGD